MARSLFTQFCYSLRDLRCRALFDELRKNKLGNVLDVGGWEFYKSAIANNVQFDSWTILDLGEKFPDAINDPRVSFVEGDGCNINFKPSSFDTVLSIQVLEHVFDPIQMFSELVRVLQPAGKIYVLVPQTSTLHGAPDHFYNFTVYWLLEAAKRNNLKIERVLPLGGRWSSFASQLLYFVFQSLKFRGMYVPEFSRGPLFWVLLPFMLLVVAIAMPICMFFSIADLKDEANNHLLVASKPAQI